MEEGRDVFVVADVVWKRVVEPKVDDGVQGGEEVQEGIKFGEGIRGIDGELGGWRGRKVFVVVNGVVWKRAVEPKVEDVGNELWNVIEKIEPWFEIGRSAGIFVLLM
jgi:hypothetical protein